MCVLKKDPGDKKRSPDKQTEVRSLCAKSNGIKTLHKTLVHPTQEVEPRKSFDKTDKPQRTLRYISKFIKKDENVNP